MFLSEAQRQAKEDAKVEKLYQEYQAAAYFGGRGAYQQKRQEKARMTTSEHCFYSLSMLVLTASLLGLIWSIISINDAGHMERETELSMYEKDELAWNNTYLEQMKGINVNIINDGELYSQQLSTINTLQSKTNPTSAD